MMRFTATIISAAISVILLCGCAKAPEPVTVDPPFFCVRDESTGGEVYLLGSMHAGKPNTQYPDEILKALSESDFLACEVDTVSLSENSAALTECTAALLCPDGKTAADYLGDDYGEISEFYKKNGIYSKALENYLPAMWSAQLSNKAVSASGLDSKYGTEQIFLNMAKQQDKPIFEIETAMGQYKMMADEPFELSRWSLISSVNEGTKALSEDILALYDAWSNSDSVALEAMLYEESPPDELSEQYSAYYDSMYTSRQRVMADCVLGWLSEGKKVFMMVGAMHYYAEPDILTLLEEAGYSVIERDNSQAA